MEQVTTPLLGQDDMKSLRCDVTRHLALGLSALENHNISRSDPGFPFQEAGYTSGNQTQRQVGQQSVRCALNSESKELGDPSPQPFMLDPHMYSHMYVLRDNSKYMYWWLLCIGHSF